MENEHKKKVPRFDSREFLANERTFMAWVRTGIAIMAFGFVVVKFSIFLQQFLLVKQQNDPILGKGYSSLLGFIIFIIGLMVVPLAYARYLQVTRQLTMDQFTNSRRLPTFIFLAILLTAGALTVYLLATMSLPHT